jgi:hypothetical protein
MYIFKCLCEVSENRLLQTPKCQIGGYRLQLLYYIRVGIKIITVLHWDNADLQWYVVNNNSLNSSLSLNWYRNEIDVKKDW